MAASSAVAPEPGFTTSAGEGATGVVFGVLVNFIFTFNNLRCPVASTEAGSVGVNAGAPGVMPGADAAEAGVELGSVVMGAGVTAGCGP